MAKIKNTDLVQKDVLGDASKSGVKFLKVLNEITESLKLTTKNAAELSKIKIVDLKSLKQVETGIKATNQAYKENVKIQQKVNETKAKLKVKTDEEIRANIQLRNAQKGRKDALRDLDILQNKNSGTLEKLNAQNRVLRRERARLNLDTDKGRKRLQEINKQLDVNNKRIAENSDKLKKQRLNVGNYSESIKNAAAESGLFSGVLGKLTTIQNTLSALTAKNTAETATNTTAKTASAAATGQLTVAQRAYNVSVGIGTKALKAFKIALASTGIGAIVLAVGALVSLFTNTQRGADKLSQGMAGLGAAFDVLIDRLSGVGDGLIKIFSGDITGGLADLKAAFAGIGDEIGNEIVQATELEKILQEVVRLENDLIAVRAASRKEVAEQRLIAKDVLRTTQERIEAAQKAADIEERLGAARIRVQEKRLQTILGKQGDALISLEQVRAKVEEIRTNAIGAIGEETNVVDALKDGLITLSEVGLSESLEINRNEALEAAAAIFQIEEESLKRRTKLEAQISSIKDQENAKRIQVALLRVQLIDDAEEKAIANEELRRDKELREAEKLGLDLVAIREISAQKIEEIRAKFAAKREAARQKELQESIDAELKQRKLINEIDQTEQQAFIEAKQREIELEEKASKRKVDLIEQKFVLRKQLLTDQAEFELLNENLTAEERDLINAKLQKDLAALERERVDEVKSTQDEIAENEKKTAEERRKEQAKTAEERRKEQAKTLNEALGQLKEFDSKRSEQRKKAIDDEISQSEKREQELLRLAEQGSEDATNNLAFEQRRQAELQQEKEKEERKAANRALALGAVESYTAKVASGDENALGNTLTEIALLSAAVQALELFYEGTEDTGKAVNGMDEHGGRLAILHDNERVMTAKQNKKIGGIANDTLADIAEMYNSGLLAPVSSNHLAVMARPYNDDSTATGLQSLAKEMRSLPKKIADEMPKESFKYDEIEKAMIHTIERKNRLERKHVKTRSI